MRQLSASLLALAAAFAVSTTASASVFVDNFDAEGATKLNYTGFANWTVENGTVDLLGTPSGYGIVCAGGSGSCVDMDGSTSDPGVMVSKKVFNFKAFAPVTFRLDVSGNQRTPTSDDISLGFRYVPSGPDISVFTRTFAGFDPFGNYGVSGFFTADASVRLLINQATGTGPGSDNIGVIIDNVKLTGFVPEPTTWALMILGIGAVGGALRRKQRAAVNYNFA